MTLIDSIDERVHLQGCDTAPLCGADAVSGNALSFRDLDISEWQDLCGFCFALHVERLRERVGAVDI